MFKELRSLGVLNSYAPPQKDKLNLEVLTKLNRKS